MVVGAWDFFALVWKHPIISCLVLLLFTPALFPVVVYFSPLLISTALCAIALISMNMGESRETEEDPYLRRWQSEQVEPEQSKPARQSWFQWVKRAEETTRLWIDDRFSKGKQDDKFNLKVIHDNDDENEVSVPSDPHILPLSGKPTKIKYGNPADEEEQQQKDRQADVGPSKSIREPEPTLTPIKQEEEEIQSVVSGNVPPGAAASIAQRPKENVFTRAPAADEVVNASTKVAAAAAPSKPEVVSSGLRVLAKEIQRQAAATPNQKAVGLNALQKPRKNPSPSSITLTTASEPKFSEAEQRGDGRSETSRLSGKGVAAQHVVQDHAGHALPSLENASLVAAQSPPTNSARMARIAAATTAQPRDARPSSETASAARSLPSILVQQPAAAKAAAAQLLISDQVLSDKVRTPRSVPSNLASTEAIATSSSEPPPAEASPTSDSSDGARQVVCTPVPMHLSSMNERLASARMMKPEPTAYNVDDMEADSPILDAEESAAQESAAVGKREGEKQRKELVQSEIGSVSISGSAGVDAGSSSTKLGDSGSKGVAEIPNEASERSNEYEKVIFVDESSKLGNHAVAGQQQRVVGEGIKLRTEVEETKGLRLRKKDVGQGGLDAEQLLGLSDKKGKDRLEDICGLATVDESCLIERATISSRSIGDDRSNVSEANQFHKSILEKGGGEQGSEDISSGSCGVGDTTNQESDGNGAKQQHQHEEAREQGEVSEISGSSTTGSINATRSLVDRRKSDNDLKRKEAENLCAVQTSDGTSIFVDNLKAKLQRDVSSTDQLNNLNEEGRNWTSPATTSSLPSVVAAVGGFHEITPSSEVDEVVSKGKKTLQLEIPQQRSRSLNIKEDVRGAAKESAWSPRSSVDTQGVRFSTDSRNAWVKANKEEENDEYMQEYLSLKKSSSLPAGSSRKEGARLVSLGKATSLPDKKKRTDDDSDTDTEDMSTRRKPWARIHNNMDSVEEITARLSKKYNWAKVSKESATTRTAISAVAIDAPRPIEPEVFAISGSMGPYTSPMRKGIDPEKSEEAVDSYMSPMKKVMSAVRNVGSRDKDGSAKNGHAPERKGLSSVLNIKRERFISPLKRVFTSESEGGKRGSHERKASKEKVGITTTLGALAEDEVGPKEEVVGSTDKFKDRLMTPLKKVFSTEANGGWKKADIAVEATPSPLKMKPSSPKLKSMPSSPALKAVPDSPAKKAVPDSPSKKAIPGSPSKKASPGSPAQKPLSGKDEMSTDKFRERFILPLKKKFSSDSNGGKKGDSAVPTVQTPEKRGLSTAIDSSGEIGIGNTTSTFDRLLKSPEKKFLSWTKRRRKDDKPPIISALPPPLHPLEAMSPGSIFETPRSPGISDKKNARVISHGKSLSISSALTNESVNAGYTTDEFLSPERNASRERKGKELAQSSKDKEKSAGGSKTSWWTRKREKVVVEEATVAEAKQPTRDNARSSPERVIGGRSVDSGVHRSFTAPNRNSASSPLLRGKEKVEEQLLTVRASPSEEWASPARTHRREHSDTLPTRFRGHERRMSLSEVSTPEKESSSSKRTSIFDQTVLMPERVSLFDKSNSAPKAQHARQRSIDVMDVRAEAHLYKSRSAFGAADHAQERCRNAVVPFSESRSDPEVNKLYRNLESPGCAEIKINDKLKVPLEEILSLLTTGDSSTRNSTAAKESSSSEETSSSEEEWSSSSDEDEAAAAAKEVTVQNVVQPVQSRKSHHFFNKGNRQLRNVDA